MFFLVASTMISYRHSSYIRALPGEMVLHSSKMETERVRESFCRAQRTTRVVSQQLIARRNLTANSGLRMSVGATI